MSKLLDELNRLMDNTPTDVIRISEVTGNGEIETLERRRVCRCQNVYSVAKTFTMTAVGILADRDLVRLDEKICDIFAEEIASGGYASELDERWSGATVEMALTHSLGLPGGFLDIDTHNVSEFTSDLLRYMLTYPLEYAPGTGSRYSDGAFYLLSRVVEKRVGECMDSFLWHELFWQLGFIEASWSHCPMGHTIGATGLYVHSADMVKLGKLYLDGGVYGGKRLLSRDWVELALTRHFGFDSSSIAGESHKGGMYGQRLMLLPEFDRVIAIQSYGSCEPVVRRIDEIHCYN